MNNADGKIIHRPVLAAGEHFVTSLSVVAAASLGWCLDTSSGADEGRIVASTQVPS